MGDRPVGVPQRSLCTRRARRAHTNTSDSQSDETGDKRGRPPLRTFWNPLACTVVRYNFMQSRGHVDEECLRCSSSVARPGPPQAKQPGVMMQCLDRVKSRPTLIPPKEEARWLPGPWSWRMKQVGRLSPQVETFPQAYPPELTRCGCRWTTAMAWTLGEGFARISANKPDLARRQWPDISTAQRWASPQQGRRKVDSEDFLELGAKLSPSIPRGVEEAVDAHHVAATGGG